jgi:hypothetical protein
MIIETTKTPDRGWMGDRRRGASMGRANRCSDPETAGPFNLRRVNLDFQGYDEGGAYWGLDGQLWEAFTDDGAEFATFRLNEAEENGFDAAAAALRRDYPNAEIRLAEGAPDDFASGYIEALFFTSNCPGVDSEEFLTDDHQEAMREGSADGTLPADVGAAELAPDALQSIIRDCQTFQTEAAELLKQAYNRGYSPEQAGRDFWFTRNRHGVGFLDRDALKEGGLGHKLSAIARTYGESNAWFGNDCVTPDSLVHVD